MRKVITITIVLNISVILIRGILMFFLLSKIEIEPNKTQSFYRSET
jgi:hypothetical protein